MCTARENTPAIVSKIVQAVVTRFARETGIEPAHLLTEPEALTSREAFNAWGALPEMEVDE